MLRFAVCGAGRIGRVHAANIARHPKARLEWVIDVDRAAAEGVADRYGAQAGATLEGAIEAVDAVLIASPTPTHVPLIELAAGARRAIFCEKPIDLDLERVDRLLEGLDRDAVPFFVGFNRRFDPSFARLKAQLAGGAIGALEMLTLTSRDPSPPPPDYVRSSGGLFRDMMIHDFDMARWLIGGDPVEVHAMASNLVDPEIGAAGDVDTAVVLMRAKSGALVQITNSRRAVYGYDQRIEAFGARGMLLAENERESTVVRYGEDGVVAEKPLHFFLERYAAAYRAELDHFVDALDARDPVLLVGPHDGRQALALADAAVASLEAGQPVPFP
jgi:myo-inositol 2-dehydrogenase/D-chiro-inositol 1-dehydrogenase